MSSNSVKKLAKPKKDQNIQVVVRCRELNKLELSSNCCNVVECSRDGYHVSLKERLNSTVSKKFTFDKVFGPQCKQLDVYQSVSVPMVEEVLSGYNCTIFAYGQTGTGKTYTMIGERTDTLRYSWENDPNAGIIPRTLSHLFAKLQANDAEYNVRVSFMELYNEEIFDLLSNDDVRLSIYEDASRKGSVVVKNLTETSVLNRDDVYKTIERGMEKRRTAATQLNEHSSRSHSVFTVTVHMKESSVTGEELVKTGKMNLVDLAGSENIGRSGAVERRAREAGSINQSLLTLGRVISALVDKSGHVPYRESKLTRILQDSLGGRTKTCIIATITPSSQSVEETLSTLDYAHRAKNILNRPEVNQKLSQKTLIRHYAEDLERMRRDLVATRDKTGVYVDQGNYERMETTLSQQRDKINNLEDLKDMLVEDLAKSAEMFTLSQNELDEMRQLKESVESELEESRTQLDKISYRLLETERQRQEEVFLKQAHQNTELRLHEQTSQMRSTAGLVESDLKGMLAKVTRYESLDQRVNSTVSAFAGNHKETSIAILSNMEAYKSDVTKTLGGITSLIQSQKDARVSLVSKTQDSIDLVKATVRNQLAEFANILSASDDKRMERLLSIGDSVADKGVALASDVDTCATEMVTKHQEQETSRWMSLDTILQSITDEITINEEIMSHKLAEISNQAVTQFEKFSALHAQIYAEQEASLTEMRATLKKYEQAHQKTNEVMKQAQLSLNVFPDIYEELSSQLTNNSKTMESWLPKQKSLVMTSSDTLSTTASNITNEIITSYTLQKGQVEEARNISATGSVEATEFFPRLGDQFTHWSDRITAIGRETTYALKSEESAIHSQQEETRLMTASMTNDINSACANLEEDIAGHHVLAEERTERLKEEVASSGTVTEEAISNVRESVTILDDQVERLVSRDMERYQPTLTTPSRRNYVYPSPMAVTSPQAMLRSRFQSQLDEEELRRCCGLPIPRAGAPVVQLNGNSEVPTQTREVDAASSGLGSLLEHIDSDALDETLLVEGHKSTNGTAAAGDTKII